MIIRHAVYSSPQFYGIAAALLIALSAQALPQDRKSDANLASPTARTASTAAAPDANNLDNIQLDRLKRSHAKDKKTNAFPAKSWYVPPPPPPPVPTPPPSAPPLPYTFMGKILEPQGKLTFFLAQGDKVHLVSAGETIDNTYTVDGVENGKLTLTYLPLQIKQYLYLGETP